MSFSSRDDNLPPFKSPPSGSSSSSRSTPSSRHADKGLTLPQESLLFKGEPTSGSPTNGPSPGGRPRSVKTGTPKPWHGPRLYGPRALSVRGDANTQSPYHGTVPFPAPPNPLENQPNPQPQYMSVTPESPFWEMYNAEATKTDKDVTQGWTSSLDVLLIITGLFSAIVTGFLVVELNPEPSESQGLVLARYLAVKARFTQSEAVTLSPADQRELVEYLSAPPEPSALRETVVACWSVSLTCTLWILIYAFYIKFWLREYERDMKNGSAFECAQRRQARWAALARWKVEAWISFLPILMLLSVGLFIAGLAMKLWMSYNKAAIAVISVSGTLLSVYIALSILPWFSKTCPYHNTALVLIPRMFIGIGSFLEGLGKRFFRRLNYIIRRTSKVDVYSSWDVEKSLPTLPFHAVPDRIEEENKLIASNTNNLTWDAVIWLVATSRQSFIVDHALRTFPSLPYTPNKAIATLATRIPQMLCSRIYGEFTVHQDDPSLRVTLDDDDSMVSSFQFSLGFTHYLKCLALDGIPSRDTLSLITSPSESSGPSSKAYHLLDERLMTQWKSIRGVLKSYKDLEGKGWIPDIFTTLVSMEALHFHLHPDNDKADPPVDNPLDEVHFFLEWHITSLANKVHDNNQRHTLVVLLNTLAHTLAALSDQHEWTRKRRGETKSILLRLIDVMTQDEFQAFQPLADCLWICHVQATRGRRCQILAQNINHNAELVFQTGHDSGYRNLLTALTASLKDGADSMHSKTVLQSLVLLISRIVPPETAAQEEALTPHIDLLLRDIQKEFDTSYNQMSADWLVDFLTHIYGPAFPETFSKRHADVAQAMQSILSSIALKVSYPDERKRPIMLKVLAFLKSRLGNANANDDEHRGLVRVVLELLQLSATEDHQQLLIRVVAEGHWLKDLQPIIIGVWHQVSDLGDILLAELPNQSPMDSHILNVYETLKYISSVQQ